jgi:hypothetical protein
MQPNHPLLSALIKLHAELGGSIQANKKAAEKLAADMLHVEAVIKMFAPSFNVSGIAVKRRNRDNPWFKRGTMFRAAVDVLRKADRPMTTREIFLAMLDAKGITTATPAQIRDMSNSVLASLQNRQGDMVRNVAEGSPSRWTLADPDL